MQGGIQQGGVNAIAADVGVGGQGHLGVNHPGMLAVLADSAQRPKRATVVKTLPGQLLIEALGVDGLRCAASANVSTRVVGRC